MPKEFKIFKSDHTAYVVSSLKDTLAFWVDGLGAKVERTGKASGETLANITGVSLGAEADIAMIEIAGQRIEFLQYHGVAPAGTATRRPYDAGAMHLALQVDDVHAAVRLAAQYGYRAQGIPQMGGALKSINIYTVGPDGATVEFMQPVAP
jgi:catechol 2,3-dioxygenase-like lactoylglutathione lyase family enzyme